MLHRIPTGQAVSVQQRFRQLLMHKREEVEMSLGKMLDQGVIEPSTSPWASPIMLVKRTGPPDFV